MAAIITPRAAGSGGRGERAGIERCDHDDGAESKRHRTLHRRLQRSADAGGVARLCRLRGVAAGGAGAVGAKGCTLRRRRHHGNQGSADEVHGRKGHSWRLFSGKENHLPCSSVFLRVFRGHHLASFSGSLAGGRASLANESPPACLLSWRDAPVWRFSVSFSLEDGTIGQSAVH